MSITPKIGDKIRTTGHTGVIVDTYTYPAGKVIYGIKWARETEVQHFSHGTIAQWMPKYRTSSTTSSTTSTLTAQQIADQLNAYEGDNIFQDLVYGIDSYDPEATEAADPSGKMNVYVFAGTEVRWGGSEWYVA